jgi:hypothetical protein
MRSFKLAFLGCSLLLLSVSAVRRSVTSSRSGDTKVDHVDKMNHVDKIMNKKGLHGHSTMGGYTPNPSPKKTHRLEKAENRCGGGLSELSQPLTEANLKSHTLAAAKNPQAGTYDAGSTTSSGYLKYAPWTESSSWTTNVGSVPSSVYQGGCPPRPRSRVRGCPPPNPPTVYTSTTSPFSSCYMSKRKCGSGPQKRCVSDTSTVLPNTSCRPQRNTCGAPRSARPSRTRCSNEISVELPEDLGGETKFFVVGGCGRRTYKSRGCRDLTLTPHCSGYELSGIGACSTGYHVRFSCGGPSRLEDVKSQDWKIGRL